jgi:hypothetical protein
MISEHTYFSQPAAAAACGEQTKLSPAKAEVLQLSADGSSSN